MKNLLKLFGLIALVAIIGFGFAACGPGADGGDGGNNNNNNNGGDNGGETIVVSGTTWMLEEFPAATLSFSNSTYTAKLGETVTDSGTYTVSETTIKCVGGDEDLATMTIIDENTLRDGKGSLWTKVQ